MAAADRAGTPVVYMATMDRGFMLELRRRAAESGFGPEDNLEGADTMGEPSERITTEVDVSDWVDAKRAAMRAHASQITEDSFFLSMPDDLFAEVWGQEWFIRVRPEPVGLGDGHREGGAGAGGRRSAGGWRHVDGVGPVTAHKVLRVHGGRLVTAERRVELEDELDALAAQGYTLVNSFAVDDNVYLVLTADGRARPDDGRSCLVLTTDGRATESGPVPVQYSV